jgi:hypothetical protein
MEPARYFPVDRVPLRMRPRLQAFGTDFGNGPADRRYFQRDELASRYLQAKRPDRYRLLSGVSGVSGAVGETDDDAHRAVLAWMERTLAEDLPGFCPEPEQNAADRYAAISAAVQEDFVVQKRDPDGDDRAIAVYVPSGWRPEQILGWSFHRIHLPVPDFTDEQAPARSLVTAMTSRGPYVRFVWTICADDVLDHHPDDGPQTRLGPDSDEGWLRIERQVTVPFPEQQASLFLIRTYLRPFSELDPEERADLAAALECLPESTARYKGLRGGLPYAIALLDTGSDASPG